jgi:Eukaryotic membrane protein family
MSRLVSSHVHHPSNPLHACDVSCYHLPFFRNQVGDFSSLMIFSAIHSALPSCSLPPSQKADILRACIIITSSAILLPLVDISKIYHSIRGQDTIKLYVIFNALEVQFCLPSCPRGYSSSPADPARLEIALDR